MTKQLTVESLTQTNLLSVAKSFSPIQRFVLGQNSQVFKSKQDDKRHDQNWFIIHRSNTLFLELSFMLTLIRL